MSLNKNKKPINTSSSRSSKEPTTDTPTISTVPQPIRKDGKSRALQSYAHIRDILNEGNQLTGKDLATFWKLQKSKFNCNLNLPINNFCN